MEAQRMAPTLLSCQVDMTKTKIKVILSFTPDLEVLV